MGALWLDVPLFIDIFFNKEKSIEKSIKFIFSSTIILYLIFPFLLVKYNEEFSLKSIASILKKSNNNIIAYKFPDLLNLSYEINKDIKEIESKENLSDINDQKVFLVSREKYKDDIDENKNFKLIYNNKSYYLYSN